MKYKLINRTKISRKVINELIQIVCPKGVDNFVVSVMYDRGESSLWAQTLMVSKKIRIYIATKNKYKYPHISNHRNLKKFGYNPVFFIRNDHEAILSLLAHELRHLWQRYVSKRKFWDGKICEYVNWDKEPCVSSYKAEKNACEYAKNMLFKYRKLKGKI